MSHQLLQLQMTAVHVLIATVPQQQQQCLLLLGLLSLSHLACLTGQKAMYGSSWENWRHSLVWISSR